MAEELSAEQIRDAQGKFQVALSQPEVPKIYANSFVCGYGNADFIVVLECNNTPAVVLNLSPTLAKALAQSITTSVSEIESGTGQRILTLEAMDQHRRSKEAVESQR